jgi:multicomponent Na+:H+ antiporter subunit F
VSGFLEGLTVLVMLTVALGLYRIERGPTGTDRMLAAMLFGTSGVALVLLLAETSATPALRDTALVFALLSAVTVVAFVKRAWGADD